MELPRDLYSQSNFEYLLLSLFFPHFDVFNPQTQCIGLKKKRKKEMILVFVTQAGNSNASEMKYSSNRTTDFIGRLYS